MLGRIQRIFHTKASSPILPRIDFYLVDNVEMVDLSVFMLIAGGGRVHA
jgi:hypothetical protein